MEQQTKLPKVRGNKERNRKGKQMETDKRRVRDGERKNEKERAEMKGRGF